MRNINPPNANVTRLRHLLWLLLFTWLFIDVRATDAQSSPVGSISGRITNQQGEPIINIRADLHTWREGHWLIAKGSGTDENGQYTITHTPGTYRLAFYPSFNPAEQGYLYAKEYYNNQRNIESAEDIVIEDGDALTGYDAELPDSGRIIGKVLNYAGDPLAGITVEATPYKNNYDNYTFGYDTTTDENGNFVVYVRSSDRHYVRFTAYPQRYLTEHYNNQAEPELADPFSIRPNNVMTIEVRLKKYNTIRGVVTDETGAFIPDVKVALGTIRFDSVVTRWSARTDVNGAYQFTDLDSDKYWLTFSKDSFEELAYNGGQPIDLEPLDTPEITVANVTLLHAGEEQRHSVRLPMLWR